MKVEVDEQLCVGSGQCVSNAPTVFTQREDGIAEVLEENPSADIEADVREAAYICPSRAIRITD